MKLTRFFAALTVLSFSLHAIAQEAAQDAPAQAEGSSDAAASDTVKARVVLDGLNNPCGVAIQPETGIVFIADSGNHQVVRLVDGKAEPAITDFPKDVYGKGPKVNIGPLGLLFLDKNTLVIGGGGQPDGQELLRLYKLPDSGDPITADKLDGSFSLAENDETKGEGNFYALASDGKAIYVTSNGDDTKGWVAKATIEDARITGFERYLATKEATEIDAPVGITFSPDGLLVVGQMGEINIPGDGLLTFYDPETKEVRLNLETELNDITAVAYSNRKQLYVLDYSWAAPEDGGLFHVWAEPEDRSSVHYEKLASLDKPTAMAFHPDGSLYITVRGEADDEHNSQGKLIRVPAGAEL